MDDLKFDNHKNDPKEKYTKQKTAKSSAEGQIPEELLTNYIMDTLNTCKPSA